jgi:hypothetical protein
VKKDCAVVENLTTAVRSLKKGQWMADFGPDQTKMRGGSPASGVRGSALKFIFLSTKYLLSVKLYLSQTRQKAEI